ncbi:MAG TPA: AAA family ATPase [Ktedonobacteraceae bacterium]|nr:AAA family ATPase [Ktedonobacteraceae bacterium]
MANLILNSLEIRNFHTFRDFKLEHLSHINLILGKNNIGKIRVLTITLALVNARDGLLLIDEFENGLHYSVQPDLWRLIFQVANRLNVQVFATTHSWDCIEAFQSATEGDTQDTAMLIRLESRKHGIRATLFDQSELSIVTREQIEVR